MATDVNLIIQTLQLKQALEALTGEDRLDASAIKNLPEAVISEAILFTTDVGAVKAGDTIAQGTLFTDFVKAIGQEVFNPTFTNPTFSLTASGAGLRVIGASTTFNLTFAFNRGSINGNIVGNIWDPNVVQNPRAGAAIDYTIDGVTQVGNVLSRTVTVAQGNNTYSGTVNYAIGDQPLDSAGNDFSTPYPAGISPSRSDSFEGVYPLFASTAIITTATEQALASMLSANNIQISLIAESGGNKQFFDIPDAWLANRALSSVQFFNTVSGSFDVTNQIATFTTSSIQKTIEGNIVNYTRYTNNAANRGDLLIRLIF